MYVRVLPKEVIMWVWYMGKIPSWCRVPHSTLQRPRDNKYRRWLSICPWEQKCTSTLHMEDWCTSWWTPGLTPFPGSQTLSPMDSLVLRPLDMDWAMLLAFKGLQPADLVMGHLSHCNCISQFSNKSSSYIYLHILIVLSLWKTLTNKHGTKSTSLTSAKIREIKVSNHSNNCQITVKWEGKR
jgi:hypothetical protein